MLSARSMKVPRRMNWYGWSRRIVAKVMPRNRCERSLTQSKNAASVGSAPARRRATSCSQVSLMFSHISEVIEPRTARAFSRHASRQLTIVDGCDALQARKRATFSGVRGRPVASNASSVSVMTSGSIAASASSSPDSRASDAPTSRMRAMFSARSR